MVEDGATVLRRDDHVHPVVQLHVDRVAPRDSGLDDAVDEAIVVPQVLVDEPDLLHPLIVPQVTGRYPLPLQLLVQLSGED